MDDDVGAGEVAGERRGDEQAHVGDVGRFRHVPERHGGAHPGDTGSVAVGGFHLLGGDETGAHAVDPHLGRPFDGQRLGEVDEPGLGRAVGGEVGVGAHAADAPDVDDRTAPVLLLHDGVGALRERQRREEVEVDDGGREAG